MTDDAVGRAREALGACRSLLVLTGAGISAESGVPTYRGPGGKYEQDSGLKSKLTAESLRARPEEVWNHVNEVRTTVSRARPNAAHLVLAEWEHQDRFPRFLIATQNVDGLHQSAGSERVSELHGSLWEIAVPKAEEQSGNDECPEDLGAWFEDSGREALLEKWSKENGRTVWRDLDVPFENLPPSPLPGARPNVLLFDEDYGDRLLWVEHFIQSGCDVVLVVGCSGGVRVLDYLISFVRARHPNAVVINANPHEDCIEGDHVYVRLKATEALGSLRLPFGGSVSVPTTHTRAPSEEAAPVPVSRPPTIKPNRPQPGTCVPE